MTNLVALRVQDLLEEATHAMRLTLQLNDAQVDEGLHTLVDRALNHVRVLNEHLEDLTDAEE